MGWKNRFYGPIAGVVAGSVLFGMNFLEGKVLMSILAVVIVSGSLLMLVEQIKNRK